MVDRFKHHGAGLSDPSQRYYDVTPGAGDLPEWPRALWIGGEGDVTVEGSDGVSVTFTAVVGLLPIRPVKVTAATATGIIALC